MALNCDECGQRHHRCDGHHDRTGQPCEQRPPRGQRLCDNHSQPAEQPPGCGKCDQEHDPRKCTSHSKIKQFPDLRSDPETNPTIGWRPCGMWRLKGMTVCRQHGGRARQSKTAARKRLDAEKAAKMTVTYGLPVDTTPTDALLDEVCWTAGHVAWLRERVQELETEALTWGKTKSEDHGATEFPGVNVTEAAVPNVWLDLYNRERKHLVEVCKSAIAANIDERRVKLAERYGELLGDVVQSILAELNLTPEQNARVPEIVPRCLRAIAGGRAA